MQVQNPNISLTNVVFQRRNESICSLIIANYLENKKIGKSDAELFFSEIRLQTPFLLKEYHYNDIANGRLKIIISLLILYKYYPSTVLLTLIEQLTQLILKDMIAFKKGVVWLNPLEDSNLSKQLLFRGSLGIFLGLQVLNNFVFGNNEFIIALTKNIYFDEEFMNIENPKDKKLLHKTLFSEKEQYAENVINSCFEHNQKESLECLLIWMINNNKREGNSLYSKIKSLYKDWTIDKIEDDFVSCYFHSGGNLFDFYENVQLGIHPKNIILNYIQINFPILVDFCSVELVKKYINNQVNLEGLFNHKMFFRDIPTYLEGNKKHYLKIIIRKYKRLNQEIVKIFHETNKSVHYQQFLKIYNVSKTELFEQKMQICADEFIIETSFFPWNNLYNKGVADVEEFISVIEKRKIDKNNIISISKYQRFNKTISWNIRDLITKKQIEFFNFFLKSPESINDYKSKTPDHLSDESIIFLTLTFIRIGLFKNTHSI
jgi:hypothetical protein